MGKKMFGIVVLSVLCLASITNALEFPEFKSGVSTTGVTANFDSLYQKAAQLSMIHDVLEHDGSHIILKYKDTGNWVIVEDDGTLVVASPSAFSLDIKGVLNSDANRMLNLIKSTGGRVSPSPAIYYVDNPYIYRTIKHDFDKDINLKLSIPNSTIHDAKLSVEGSDYGETDWTGKIEQQGQHYYIDGIEVSGCDLMRESHGLPEDYHPSGKSCVPGSCPKGGDLCEWTREIQYVSVVPVGIKEYLSSGIHELSSSGVGNEHVLRIEAITSESADEMLLFPGNYEWVANETRSRPMSELYAIITPTAVVANTTVTATLTNITI
jgi:hypothetical protein